MNKRPSIAMRHRISRHAAGMFLGVASLALPLATAIAAAPVTAGGSDTTRPIEVPTYLNNLYIWMLGFVGIAALFAIVAGGVIYMFSGTSLTKVDSAKRWISNAIFGIILAAGGVLLLSIINPDLVTHGFNLDTIITGACSDNGC